MDKTFPDEFWLKLTRVKECKSFSSMKKQSYVGHWVNDIVYSRLVPGITNMLKEMNPRKVDGNRGHKRTTSILKRIMDCQSLEAT